jgi:ribosomal protein S4
MIYAISTDKFTYSIGMISSISAARRLREAGAVYIDGVKYLIPWILCYA